jgi:hypothetical protein
MTYEGETLTERFRAYVIELIYTDYEEKYETLFENEMWAHYLSKAVVKKYPAVKVMAIYNEYVADVEYQYKNNGGELYDQYTGSYVKYETLEEFAVAYLGLRYSADKDWRTRLYNMAKNLVKERLILYYLIQVEDIAPADVEFSAIVESIKQEYIEEYIKRYL